MIRRLWLREPTQPFGGRVLSVPLVDEDDGRPRAFETWARAADEVDGADMLFVIHGFNVNVESGLRSLDMLADRLRAGGSDRLIVPVLWPGDMDFRVLQMVSFLSYCFEYDNADQAGVTLADLIVDHLSAARRVSFLSHSLGGRVLMRAARRLVERRHAGDVTPRLGDLCLFAPAIDDDVFTRDAAAQAAREAFETTTVLGSRADRTLQWAYPMGDFGAAVLAFFRREKVRLALGYHGSRPSAELPAPVHETILPKKKGVDHGHYFPGAVDPSDAQRADHERAVAFALGAFDPNHRPRWRP